MVKLFSTPFADNGDRKDIDTMSSSGVVSYYTGYTAQYEKDLVTDPSARNIDRLRFNGLLYDITSSIYDIQSNGSPSWFPNRNYNKGAMVSYKGETWTSMVGGNGETPGQGEKWSKIIDLIDANSKGNIVKVPIWMNSGEVVINSPKKCNQIYIRGFFNTSRDFLGDTISYHFTVNGVQYDRFRYGNRGGGSGHSYYSSFYIPLDQLIDMSLSKGDPVHIFLSGGDVTEVQVYIEFL